MRKEGDGKTISLAPLGTLEELAFTPLGSATQLVLPLCQVAQCTTLAPERTSGSLGTDHHPRWSRRRALVLRVGVKAQSDCSVAFLQGQPGQDPPTK